MRIGTFDFRPSLWPTVATLLLLPLMTGLGIWQLERASWKQELVDMHEGRGRLSPIGLVAASEGGDLQYRRVFARGHYDMEHQLLLDNRTFNGHAGYHVLTPLKLADLGKVVLVNRGWVPVGSSRAVLPEIPGTYGEVLVDATIKLPPKRFFRLGEMDEPNTTWPKVVQQLQLDSLGQMLGVKLEPLILLLDKEDQFGFIRDWKPVYGVTPEKHMAYAVQWFTLAVVLLMIYLGVNSKRISKDK